MGYVDIVRDGYEAVCRGEPDAAFAMLGRDATWEGVPGVEGVRAGPARRDPR